MFDCPPGYPSHSRLPSGASSQTLSAPVVVQVQDMLNVSKSVAKQLDALVDSGRRDAPDEDENGSGGPPGTNSSRARSLPVFKYTVCDLGGTQRYMVILDVPEPQLPQPCAVIVLENAPVSHGVLMCERAHFRQLVAGQRPSVQQKIQRLQQELAAPR